MFQNEGYPLEWLQELKDKNNIVEVISRYVPLKLSGGNYWGCCPFHHETKGSFSVKEDDQYYHCFGCGESGDVIKFIQKIENLSFPEAVEFLAERAGMQIPNNNQNSERIAMNKKYRDRLYEMLRVTAKFYHETLMSDKGVTAREYLEGRGISRNLIIRFGLGYSPDFEGAIELLRTKGYSNKEIIDCGVGWMKKDGNGLPFDALQKRFVVPIFDRAGRVVAFSGRAINKDYKGGKYIHYKNTALFEKNKIIYGANFVKKEKIRTNIDKVIVVEGYMDVISLAKFGYNNAVAGMGTAFTAGQARELHGLCDNIYVCYDGDAAGQEAALKNLKVLNDEGVSLHIATIPNQGMDPDDYVKKYGREGFEKLLKDALPYVEYVLSRIAMKYDLKTNTGRAKYVKEALDFVGNISNSAQQEVYLEIIHDKSRVSVDTLRNGLSSDITTVIDESNVKTISRDNNSGLIDAARFVLNSMATGDAYAKPNDIISNEVFGDNDIHKLIYDYLKSVVNKGNKPAVHMLYSLSKDEEVARVVNQVKEFSDESKLIKFYRDSVRLLNRDFIEYKLKVLAQQYDAAEGDGKREILLQIMHYQNELKKYG